MTVDRTALDASMRRLADGDRDALGDVYAVLWPPVRALCERLVGRGAADDVAQRALLKLFEQAFRYDAQRDALRWAYALATWECRTERKRRVRAKLTAIERAPDVASEDTPEDALIVREAIEQLRALVGTLSARDREVLERVAAGEPLNALFRKRKQRALERLRSLWLMKEASDER